MMFTEGQSIGGHIGLECLNATSYDTVESVCGPNGTIVYSDAIYTCPETNPNCVQCGARGAGAALCLDTTQVPSYCSKDGVATTSPASSPTSEESGCLVGDMMFMAGDNIGYIGLECLNSTSFDATESVCGNDGNIEESDAIYTCPETSSYCVQCGERGVGAALCLDSPEVPSDCSSSSSTTTAEITDEAPVPTPATPTTESSPSNSSTAASTPSNMNSSVKNVASMGAVFAGSVFVYGVQSL